MQWDLKRESQPGVVTHAHNPGTLEPESEGLLQTDGQPGLHSKYSAEQELERWLCSQASAQDPSSIAT